MDSSAKWNDPFSSTSAPSCMGNPPLFVAASVLGAAAGAFVPAVVFFAKMVVRFGLLSGPITRPEPVRSSAA